MLWHKSSWINVSVPGIKLWGSYTISFSLP